MGSRRERLARGIERLIEAADRPRPRLTSAIPPQREQIREARAPLTAIVLALRAPGPVDPDGVAVVAELLRNGDSPAFAPAPPGALLELAARARDALYLPSTEGRAPREEMSSLR